MVAAGSCRAAMPRHSISRWHRESPAAILRVVATRVAVNQNAALESLWAAAVRDYTTRSGLVDKPTAQP
jgi:hypothetical protein